MSLNVAVKSEPKGLAKGRLKCDITDNGLVLTQGNKQTMEATIGTPARYDGKNKLSLKIEDYTVEVTVANFGSYQNRLTKHLVAFLKGKGPPANIRRAVRRQPLGFLRMGSA